MSSIFISHSSKDKPCAEQVATWLREKGYEALFLDFDDRQGIEAGSKWREEIYHNLRISRAVVALCSENFVASQWCLSEVAIAVDQGKYIFPVRIGEGALPNLVNPIQAVDLREDERKGLEKLTQALNDRLNWRDRLLWDSKRPPYPGLPAFQVKDAAMFFGRDEDIENVVERLRSLREQRRPTLLLVLGASGCGKSSLVRAGAVPKLRADADRSWIVIEPFNPDLSPFLALQEALRPQFLAAALDPPSIYSDVRARQLLQPLQLMRSRCQAPEGWVVFVIDQFEELLARSSEDSRHEGPVDPSEAERFLEFLHELLTTPGGSVTVLATLRTDFLANFQSQMPKLLKLASTMTLVPIRREDFGEVINGPANRAGLTLQPGLKERLIQESGTGDALPLLAFTLKELWKLRQERGTAVKGPEGSWWDLTLKDYDDLGGVTGSVKEAAERAHRPNGPEWPEGRSEEETAALREAFLGHLVRLSEDGPATKQPARWRDLPELSKPILREFVEARLLVSGKDRDTIEVAHEALLRTWPMLQKWLQEGRMELEQRRRVRRLCEDLATMEPPLKLRLDALRSLQRLTVDDTQPLQEAEKSLVSILSNDHRPPHERALAVRILGIGGSQMVEDPLMGLLQREHLREETDWERAAAILTLLTSAASALLLQLRKRSTSAVVSPRSLLVPSATLSADGLAVSTTLVSMKLWPSVREAGEFPLLRCNGNGNGKKAWFEELNSKVVLTMVKIPAGALKMGSTEGKLEGSQEGPQHQVQLESFFMSQAPITQLQWKTVAAWVPSASECWGRDLNPDPSRFQGNDALLLEGEANTELRPVEGVSWYDAMEFCRRLSQRTKRTYTLPSEAQWEYACRAGTTTPFHYGETITTILSNYCGNYFYGQGQKSKGKYREQTTPVGSFAANAWGLYDMHGNVWEWCLDQWHPSYVGAPVDGSARIIPKAAKNTNRLLRGGSWFNDPWYCRSASRNHSDPSLNNDNVGLRVVCLPPSAS